MAVGLPLIHQGPCTPIWGAALPSHFNKRHLFSAGRKHEEHLPTAAGSGGGPSGGPRGTPFGSCSPFSLTLLRKGLGVGGQEAVAAWRGRAAASSLPPLPLPHSMGGLGIKGQRGGSCRYPGRGGQGGAAGNGLQPPSNLAFPSPQPSVSRKRRRPCEEPDSSSKVPRTTPPFLTPDGAGTQ